MKARLSHASLDPVLTRVCLSQRGDTPVHIAVRGRYRRICELLLRNPKDARLLYRPNKSGETPYNIDRQHKHSLLTQIFGTGKVSVELFV